MNKKDFFGLNKGEIAIVKKLNTPKKIQDFINSLKINFEPKGDTCQSPRMVLKSKTCHCIEGAILAATILRFHNFKPLLLDIESTKKDFDHVVALFKVDGFWGAISKTNHAVLRYREPIYKTIRELAMSYFHEYFLDSGQKTLRGYSSPVDLSRFDNLNWISSEEEIWFIPNYLADIKHKPILTRKQIANLRKADKIEIESGKLTEY
ncbi:MAG: transglutaminase-like domain-containing protein [Nanoarchaeota archaeon]